MSYNPNGYAVGTYVNTAPAGSPSSYSLLTGPGGVACGGTIAADSAKPICIAPLAPLVKVHTDRQKVADIGVPQQPSVDITHGFSANLRYTAAPWLELRSITAWRGVSTDQWDNSGGANRSTYAPNATFSRYSLSFLKQHQFSQELQGVGSSNGFSYVFGAYYYTENATEICRDPAEQSVERRRYGLHHSQPDPCTGHDHPRRKVPTGCTSRLAVAGPRTSVAASSMS